MIARIKAWLDGQLLPHWHQWYKHVSMWLATAAAAVIAYLTAVPSALNDALHMLPDSIRATLPAWIGPTVFFLLFVARFWDQRKDKADGQQ
ncbi:hypothetical protein [Sphingomonas oligoaromativorans]|uniref:DUF7940 domain-containing protein n=1 Tax=Sphingomonas oligoaromativorans TaxID=575322 RepID=UPI00141FEEDD|nr:hypothetical protein [Sphingomonas oligoaromativorans]NIJ34346.1 hypothetical protein [Sphingomonas oligoaromativorans]